MKITTVAGAAVAVADAGSDGSGRKTVNSELWHACAGPLVTSPPVGSLVVYFPQGHSEQVAASMQTNVDGHVPNYPNLPYKLICFLHNHTLHADPETDEVYAQMTLQPVNSYDEKALLVSDLALKPSKPQTEFFCKILTASDTSTHGGFSVPRRAAEKIFPPLDFSMQPPAQELQASDLHDNVWTFRHIYRGQPKRHLLTTGWSLFVSRKRLLAGDSVLFIRDDKQQLLLGIRRANRQPTNLSSSVLSSDSMHIGILAAAAHAAANNSPFTVFYNPRASPSEFVIPLAKYNRAVYSNQISLGMRFRMMFETEESGTRRYMGTITGINDLDPVRWKNSKWRNLQVGWDEAAPRERRNRVSIWELEPVVVPFFICPPFFRTKHPRQSGIPDYELSDMENLLKRAMPWLGEEICIKDSQSQNTVMPSLSLAQWMNMQQSPLLGNSAFQPDHLRSVMGATVQNLGANDLSKKLGSQAQFLQQNDVPINAPRLPQQAQSSINQLSTVSGTKQQIEDLSMQQRHQFANQTVSLNKNQIPIQQQPLPQNNLTHPQILVQNQIQQQQSLLLNQHIILKNLANNSRMQKLQQQQSLLSSPILQQSQLSTIQEQQRVILESLQNPAISSNQSSQQQQTIIPQQLLQEKLHQQGMPLSDLPRAAIPATSTILSSSHGNSLIAGGTQSVLTDDITSCSTSPSTNNCVVLSQPSLNKVSQHNMILSEKSNASTATILNPISLEALESVNLTRELPKSELNVKPSIPIPKSHGQGVVTQTYLNNVADYLDSSSSETSVCLWQNDGSLHQSFCLSSFNQPHIFKDSLQHNDVQEIYPGNNTLFGGMPLTSDPLFANGMGLGKFQNQISGNEMSDCVASKDTQQELSSSMISQSFGVPDLAFNSIDSTITDSSILNRNSCGAAPQLQRMRTYTKVYKRGSVGRSIDITRYSSYDELKLDLARMFSIEGPLEDRQRIGWKLVYVDHENDVLLVGDDPWQEFVSCVRYIRILSPQEVQHMSLAGDLGNNVIANKACSSSVGGNSWRAQRDPNSVNPSAGLYGHFD